MPDIELKHRKNSGVADGVNASLVQPSDWNANIAFTGPTAGLVVFPGNGSTPQSRVIEGTANQITVANGNGTSGNPTLSLPQNIHVGATPTFTSMTGSGLTASRVVIGDANKTLSSSAVTATELSQLSGITSTQLLGVAGLTWANGTAYTIVASDVAKLVIANNASACNITVPSNANVSIPTCAGIALANRGGGNLTLIAGGGVVLRGGGTNGTFVLASNGGCSAIKIGTDEWLVKGDFA